MGANNELVGEAKKLADDFCLAERLDRKAVLDAYKCHSPLVVQQARGIEIERVRTALNECLKQENHSEVEMTLRARLGALSSAKVWTQPGQ